MFHSFFFNSLARSKYLCFFSHSFSFILWSAETAKTTILQILFLLWIIIRSGPLAEIRWSVGMSKSHWSLCIIFWDRCWVVNIPFVCMVKFEFLAHLPVDHLANPVMSNLVTDYLTRMGIKFRPCSLWLCYFVASYLFSLWYDWFLWRYFVLLLGEIVFLS